VSESSVLVTPGVGPDKLHADQKTIGGVTVKDEVVVHGEQYLASYTASANGVSTATGGHVIQLMAGASLNVRVRALYIVLFQATAAGAVRLGWKRLTTAGTGGTVVTPNKMDNADAASGATAMTLPTVVGTVTGDYFWQTVFQTAAAAPQPTGQNWLWENTEKGKPLIIPAGTTNGIGLVIVNTAAGSTVSVTIEFDESNF
jgi:hypothetical protein